jgi:hypothetical protein
LWALAGEPSAAHIVGRWCDVAIVFFEDALALRLGNSPGGTEGHSALKSIPEKAGFLGDFKSKTFQPVGDSPVPNYPTAWLPTARVARAHGRRSSPRRRSRNLRRPCYLCYRGQIDEWDVKHLTASELEAGRRDRPIAKNSGVLDLIVRRPQTGA